MSAYTLDQLRAAAPAQFRELDDEDLVREYARTKQVLFEQAADYYGVKPRGTLGEMRRQAAGGAMVDLPRMVGQGLKATGIAPTFGQELVEGSEERAYQYDVDRRPERGLFSQALTSGARGLAPTVPIIASAFVPGGQVIAPAMAAGLFGTSSYQETYEKVLEQTGDEAAARAAAIRVGALQGGGEGIATAAFGALARPVLGAVRGRPTTAGVAQAATDTSIIRPLVRGQAINIPTQAGTEALQDVGTEVIERSYGTTPEDIGEIAKESALAGAGLSLLLGIPLGVGGSATRARRAQSLKDALYNPDTPVETRAKAMDLVMGEARRQGVAEQDVDTWFNQQLELEDARTAALRAAEQEEKTKEINLLGEKAQELEGLQGGVFSSLDQQRAFEQGLAGVQIDTPFSSLEQQQAFTQGLETARDNNIARVGEQFQDLMGGRASTLTQAQDIGQQAQSILEPQQRALAAATQAGEQSQEIRADKTRTMMDIDDMGQEWQKLSKDLPQPVTGELSRAQKAALRGPEGKRFKPTSSPFVPTGQGPASTTLLEPAQNTLPIALPISAPAPSSLLSDRPAAEPVTPVGAPTAVAAALPAAPVAAGVSSTPVTTGAPSGTKAPQAKQTKTQGQKEPVAAGSVVKVNDTEVTLDEAQATAWNTAQEAYDGKVRRAKAITNYQERDSALRAAGMQLSAERRKITGALTAKEQEAAGPKNVAEAIKEDNEIDRVLKAVEAEDDKADKLFASVTGDTKKAPGKPSMPTQVYAAIRNAILNPKGVVMVRKPKSVEKDVALTEKYKDKVKRIAAAAKAFADAYETYSSINLVRGGAERPETIKRDTTADAAMANRAEALLARARAVRSALAELGEAVDGNAKDVEAIVRFVKDRAQKEKRSDNKVVQNDILLSRAWTAAKSESFMGEPDLLATTGAEVRQSREAAARGATPQLVDAATEGYATFGRGPVQTGLNGILNYIRTVGTPFEKILAQAIKLAVAGKAPINIKFVKEGTSQYDPKTNTITINETSSKEVALHEALHGALQWFVYTNPNAAQVVALKAALQRVVNYDGKLPPKAAEVQALLKKILAGKSKTAELDAVLELVSYGNTLNDFRRALQGMESNAPRTFTKFANDVMDAIYALVRRMLGSSQTVASDVMENTFQLLEAARAATQETAPKKGNVLQAAIDTTTDAFKRWFSDSKVTEKGGKAKVVYTGTSKDKDFTAFKVPRNGVWFTDDPKAASQYAVENDSIGFKWEGGRPVEVNTASRVIPAFLRVENPYTMTPADMARINKENYKKAQGDFFDTLRAQGYDGVDMGDGIWVVLKEPAQIKSSIGNRGTFDPTSGNILKAEITSLDAAAKEAGWADATAFAKGPGAFKTPTQVAFELIGLGRVNGKDLPITTMIKESGAKTAEYIRKNVPTLERMILNFNSKFSNGSLVNDLIERFKFMQNTGYLQMERISQHLMSHPETAKPFLDFMDGNSKALDGVQNGAAFKAIAENLQTLMKQYIDSLPANSPERRAFQNVKFSQYLLHPENIGQVAGSTFGVKKLASMLGVERRAEASLDEFKPFLKEDADGRVDIDDPLYQLFEDKGGQSIPFGFISIEKFNNGLVPAGVKVATDRVWKMSQYKEGAFQFTSSKATVSEARSALKTEELSAALLNTTAALAHTFASRNFLNGIANIGRADGKATSGTVAFNDVEELNAAFPDARITKEKLLEVSDESSKSPQIRWRAQRTGVWIKLPESETYGPLAGKIIPGPVWNSMLDMHDRAPLVNIQAFNDVMAFFKKSKTVYNPGTHVTNILSNVTLAILHGITPSTMGRAAKMFLDFERNPDGMRKEDLALMKAFYASGAVLGQFSSTEVKKTVYDKLNQAITPDSDSSYITKLKSFTAYERAKAQLTKYDNMASELYAAEDNVFRLAAFLNTAGNIQVRDGSKTLSDAQLEEAGLAGRKLFLDYDIDARAIRAMRQSFMPFISWSYAIMPVLGRIAIEKPWAMANVLMTYALMSAALGGDEDEEKRKLAPEYLRDRAWGGLGPYMHMRLPFLGDDENPVYFNLGKYIPMFTLFQPPPGESKLAGQEWVPGFATPSGPLATLLSAMNGYDPFTGKPMHDPTDTQWDKLVNTGKAVYNTMAPAAVNTNFWKNVGDLTAGVTGPTGVEKSALFLARNLGGLGLYQFNVDESAFYQRNEVKKIKREFDTAIAKAKRLEYSKGYPDYEALDAELDDLRTRLQEEIAKARGEE